MRFECEDISEESLIFHKKIGEGVSATVWLAEDRDTHELYAVKSFKAIRSRHNQFRKEVGNLIFLNARDPGNKFVPKLYGIINGKTRLCIVMELIRGRTVSQELLYSPYENAGLPITSIR